MLGPEVGGLIALAMIGMVVLIIAWLNCSSCKLGRHNWTIWVDRPEKDPKVLQERRCKKCNRLETRAPEIHISQCEYGRHEWIAWSIPTESNKIGFWSSNRLYFQERSCKYCNAYESKYFNR